MNLQLFPDQQKVVDDIAAAFRAGHRRIMVSAACGFGKTELATAILAATKANGRRGIFVADRIALVTQTGERFDKYGLDHGIVMADHWRYRPSEPVQIASVQTVQRRGWPAANLLVVDEAHVLAGAVKAKLSQADCYAIGLSATAVTKGLGKFFDTVVNAPTTNELIRNGRLVPVRIFACAEPDMEGVKVNGLGEWDEKETEKRALQVVGDVVQEYLKHGQGKKFIGFAASIDHATELQRQFLSAGINVATYTANDKPEDRSEVVQEFRKPDSSIRGIFSVEALTRGFDVAEVEVLIMARPLRKALAVFVQMLGRVMRTAPGKDSALLLDHSGNSARFWHQWNDLFENGVQALDDGKPKKEKKKPEKTEVEPVKCPQCRALHAPMSYCPSCGFEYPKRVTVQHVPGTLKELLASTGHQDIKLRSIWPQVVGYVLERSTGDQLADQRKAQAIYKTLTGDFARARIEYTEPVECGPEVRNRIRANNIRRAYGRQKEAAHAV